MKNEVITCSGAMHVLAFMGDLSMGQPVDHSPKVAWIARRIAEGLKLDLEQCQDVAYLALLRWIGCTANAGEVANVMTDDVRGRGELLALRPQSIQLLVAPNQIWQRTNEISAIHCEVALMIANILGMRPAVLDALGCLFETWDGNGHPNGLKGDQIPLLALVVILAGDIEILTREYGVGETKRFLDSRAGAIYPKHLVDFASQYLLEWIDALGQPERLVFHTDLSADSRPINLSLLADTIDLKLPWLTGHSRTVSSLAGKVAAGLNLDRTTQEQVRRAALIHGLGRVSVPNAMWNRPGPLSRADWERVRLSPYWTARAAIQIRSLEREAEIASYAYERLDGSGYFRSARHAATPVECRILPAVAAWVALRAPRPWRAQFTFEAAADHLRRQALLSRFDQSIVDLIAGASASNETVSSDPKSAPSILTPRELDVLRCVSQGENNKTAA
ncbi:MAG: HD domain-containing phosphohydrolase, partial [Pseudomonadota bacterium]